MLFKFSYSETTSEPGLHIATNINGQNIGYGSYGCLISVEDYHHLLQNITYNGYIHYAGADELYKLKYPTVLNTFNNKLLLDASLCGLLSIDYEWYKQHGHFEPTQEEIERAAKQVSEQTDCKTFMDAIPRGIYIYDEVVNMFRASRRKSMICKGALFNIPFSDNEKTFIKMILPDCLNEIFHNPYVKFTSK